MKKELTREFVMSERGCYSREQAAGLSFMKNNQFTVLDVVNSEIPLKDKYWFITKKCLSTQENQELAIGVASIVLEIYENEYPNDKRPREAIQAAKDYLAGVIGIQELRDKRAAAAAVYAYADAAVYVAVVAAAAAYAAVVVVVVAYAAVVAAAAAAAAVEAAAYAAANKKDYKCLLFQYLIDFINSH